MEDNLQQLREDKVIAEQKIQTILDDLMLKYNLSAISVQSESKQARSTAGKIIFSQVSIEINIKL